MWTGREGTRQLHRVTECRAVTLTSLFLPFLDGTDLPCIRGTWSSKPALPTGGPSSLAQPPHSQLSLLQSLPRSLISPKSDHSLPYFMPFIVPHNPQIKFSSFNWIQKCDMAPPRSPLPLFSLHVLTLMRIHKRAHITSAQVSLQQIMPSPQNLTDLGSNMGFSTDLRLYTSHLPSEPQLPYL